jgi:hypothetical protein
MKSYLPALVIMTMLLASSCSTRSATAPADNQLAANTCEIDAQKVCEDVKYLRHTVHDGEMDSDSQREQNAAPTQNWFRKYETPDKTIIEISCELNIRHHKVIYAKVIKGAALTNNDVEYLRSQNMCVE